MMQLRAHNANKENFNYCVFIEAFQEGSQIVANVVRNYEDGTTEILYSFKGPNSLNVRTQMRKKKVRMMQVKSGKHLLGL
ncbi:hypothetical protein RVBP17_0080 [Pseudomonas phage sp. 30-3]|uniref:Uncharacterized protein n=1 Tax=Pseudomonas phage vB_PaeM_PA5oct TaxID=2163605 RepID=A0A4Y5JTB9_9CAUD|nr:hypothetical protein PQE65_gp389 [Pseudomonas phage vB_PaeM_PA5oct]WMI32050.1 hypothetical protein GBBBJNDB_00359 [Pseudomonas phage Callisto]WPK40101.1 hypothetical protein ETTORE_0392 [Pseudomonas phage Ettore]VOH55857.1 hypothetical protein MIJ3_00356 [Pseudomonas phage vB_PaeM_MIJ3]BDR25950.1 hypothetical protein RVBP16_3900 [Pseudomonas phage sp. 30-2]BDR25965.1 hypothetical protein RVBP17_0080 [Pseudomonas phage sp. 30-3]